MWLNHIASKGMKQNNFITKIITLTPYMIKESKLKETPGTKFQNEKSSLNNSVSSSVLAVL